MGRSGLSSQYPLVITVILCEVSHSICRWIVIRKFQTKGDIMSEEKKCLRCNGINLEPSVFQSTGKIYSRPQNAKLSAVFNTGVPVNSLICLDCGHVELHVDAEKAKSLSTIA